MKLCVKLAQGNSCCSETSFGEMWNNHLTIIQTHVLIARSGGWVQVKVISQSDRAEYTTTKNSWFMVDWKTCEPWCSEKQIRYDKVFHVSIIMKRHVQWSSAMFRVTWTHMNSRVAGLGLHHWWCGWRRFLEWRRCRWDDMVPRRGLMTWDERPLHVTPEAFKWCVAMLRSRHVEFDGVALPNSRGASLYKTKNGPWVAKNLPSQLGSRI